ncbi:carboxyl-terminal protease [Alcanivorax hongdengensis A-11-3]|uniref:Carboxyl-terminal protease n=1 Tax=Alcanivorax hongdengensis A-11-3 TaxID=1177179 RepID=L0WEI1_9GAMM|nr:S41 family peptidase [Alcanivorax hongdengensis]EKF75411.1 carboxyl-terminal protease [Alcanivorax hongdengensis A-11-3]
MPIAKTTAYCAALLLTFLMASPSIAAPAPADNNTDNRTQPALDEQAKKQGVPVDELRAFAEVLERIRGAYIEKVDDRELLESAIRGMLYELDPHSNYLTPDQFDDLQTVTTGEFGGLGIEVTMENGFVKVVTPVDDSPASKAGIQSGDLILKIDDTFVKGLSLNEAVELMRGKIGSKVELMVLSDGDDNPHQVTLTRDRIQMHSVRARMLEPGLGYLRISQFQNNTGEDTRKAIEKLEKDAPLKGLVLDLRNNPGGVLNGAVEVSDLFLNQGLIVYTQGREESSRNDFKATPGDMLKGAPLVVLVNGGTASASEIVSGALQDQSRAIIVGSRTFGKGSVQTVLPLSGDRALKLTTARYYTPKGRSIQAEGITPDIPVEVAKVELRHDMQLREADLPRHLDNENGDQPAKNPANKLALEDYPLSQALAILKGIVLSRHISADNGANNSPDDASASQ